jgi:hypothetical protein
MDYACPIRRSAARTCQKIAGASVQVCSHCYQCILVDRLLANSRWFRSSILCQPQHISNSEIRLIVSWCGEPLSNTVRQKSTLNESWPMSPRAYRRRPGSTNLWLPVKRWPCRHTESCPTGTFRLPWLRFFRAFFLSCEANTRVKHAQRGKTRTLPRHGGFISVLEFRCES